MKRCGTIRHVVKGPLRKIGVLLAILVLFTVPEVGEAGPFEDFFRSIRNSFARPAQKPRKPGPAPSHRSSRKQKSEAPPSDTSDASTDQASPTPRPVPAPPTRNNVRAAKPAASTKNRNRDLPYGIPVPGKPGLVTSPFSPESGYVDVRSFPPGTEVTDPYSGKTFLTP